LFCLFSQCWVELDSVAKVSGYLGLLSGDKNIIPFPTDHFEGKEVLARAFLIELSGSGGTAIYYRSLFYCQSNVNKNIVKIIDDVFLSGMG
jgi:hypothetical protein